MLDNYLLLTFQITDLSRRMVSVKKDPRVGRGKVIPRIRNHQHSQERSVEKLLEEEKLKSSKLKV